MKKPISRNVGVRDLLDLLIHSFTFGEAIDDEGRVDGFFVTSDKKRHKLWLIEITAFTKLMRDVGKDYPHSADWRFDEAAEDYIVWQGKGTPPPHFRAALDRKASRPNALRDER